MEVITIITIILVLLGMLPLLLVLIKRSRIKAFIKKAITTTAVVNNCEKRIGFKGAVYYFLSLEFNTPNDNKIIQGVISGRKQETGDRIPLMYLPENPHKFSIDFGRKIPLAIALTALFFIIIVAVCIWLNIQEYSATT